MEEAGGRDCDSGVLRGAKEALETDTAPPTASPLSAAEPAPPPSLKSGRGSRGGRKPEDEGIGGEEKKGE